MQKWGNRHCRADQAVRHDSHALSTIRDASTIVVMDSGRIVEQGQHTKLLRRRGLSYSLYNSQFAEDRHLDERGRSRVEPASRITRALPDGPGRAQ